MVTNLEPKPFAHNYTAKELEQFQRALKGASIGKGRALTPEETASCRAKVKVRIEEQRRAEIQSAKMNQAMVNAPSFNWRQASYRRDK